MSGDPVVVLAAFLACGVEAVEALTIVLAAGVTRSWRAAFQGSVAAAATLAVIVAALGPALTLVPLSSLRLIVGGLLLIFGLGWLRKAVLRAAGVKGRHDEEAIYAREVAAAASAGVESRPIVGDWYAFTLAYKGVLLEGLEVAFIVLTLGANATSLWPAVIGAAAAVVVVTAAGFAVRRPLARVPENTLKFAVGAMLTSFGAFWGAEGAGASWPGGDVALFVLLPSVLVMALAMVAALRAKRPAGAMAR